MALYASLSQHAASAERASSAEACPRSALRCYCFDDEEQRVDAGSAVLVARGNSLPLGLPAVVPEDGDEFEWSPARTADFLAGGPLTLGWVTKTAEQPGSSGVYICCWVTVGD